MTSRRVGLTAAFLALAAGATAACDNSPAYPAYPDPDDDYVAAPEPVATTRSVAPSRTPAPRRTTKPPPPPPAPPAEDVFYCADEDGWVVDDWHCDEEEPEYYDPSLYYLWHSPHYRDFWVVGDHLPGGRRVAVDDATARREAGLPATGFVGNGSVKTNIVGRSSSSSGSSGGSSGDGSTSGG